MTLQSLLKCIFVQNLVFIVSASVLSVQLAQIFENSGLVLTWGLKKTQCKRQETRHYIEKVVSGSRQQGTLLKGALLEVKTPENPYQVALSTKTHGKHPEVFFSKIEGVALMVQIPVKP